MSYTDITKPVVFNVTVQSNPRIDNYTRRMSIVSTGKTTLEAGSFKIVNSNNYKDILKDTTDTSSEFARQLNSFFAYSNNKAVNIVELGVIDGSSTPTVPTYNIDKMKKDTKLQVNPISNYDKTASYNLTELKATAATGDSVPTGATKQATVDGATYYFNDSGALIKGDGSKLTKYLNKPVLPENTPATTAYIVSLKDGGALYFFSKEGVLLKTDTTKGAEITIGDYINPKVPDTTDPKASAYVQALKNFINDKISVNYFYLCPSSWYSVSSGLNTLANDYNNETSHQYFMITATPDVDPSTDSTFKAFSGMKSMMVVYDNSDDDFIKSNSLAGAILGVIASTKFDINATNKASPLNYKTLNGYKFKSLKNNFLQNLINAPCNFVFDEIGLPTIGNGRYTDGSTFEYWYQWDITQLALNAKISTMIIQGVNNPNYVIQYNQQGIDTLNASIKSVLTNQQSMGIVNQFAQGVNTTNNELIGEGDIIAIDFNTYISEFPEDYENEVYKGISFFLRIGRYIRQVVINVTLN